jgi:Bacterial toxin YdaS
MSMPSTHSFVPRKRKRGDTRSANRNDRRDAIMRSIFAKDGFATEIAKHLGVTHQNVSAWNRVPAHHVLEVAEMLDMTPEQIRPDVFSRRRR